MQLNIDIVMCQALAEISLYITYNGASIYFFKGFISKEQITWLIKMPINKVSMLP